MPRLALAPCLLALAACSAPLRAPLAHEVTPLRAPGVRRLPPVSVVLGGRHDWPLDDCDQRVALALRTSELFERVTLADPGAPLQVRVEVRQDHGRGYLPLPLVFMVWRERLELEFQLFEGGALEAGAAPLFTHRGTRAWTMLGSLLVPLWVHIEPAGPEFYAFVREALVRGLETGALAPGDAP